MKEKTRKRIRGSITVLLVIILLPMMTFSAVIVDSSRINMARSMVSSAGDLAMNTALANYDTILKDVYGLFAMSQLEDPSGGTLASNIRSYFQKTLVSYGVVSDAESGQYVDSMLGDINDWLAGKPSGELSNFLDMEILPDAFIVEKPSESSLAHADILRAQIVEYMKYRAPINFGLSFLDSVNAFKKVGEQAKVVQAQVKAQEYVQNVTQACRDTIDEIRKYDDLINDIQTGEKAVKGKNSPSDTETVGLGEYHLQVDKYYNTWGEKCNYEHINLLNLIFLLKSPSVDSVYLKNFNIFTNEWYIPLNITTSDYAPRYENSGISRSPSLAGTTQEAKAQVQTQMDKLNGDGPEKTVRDSYTGILQAADLNISASNLMYHTFANEDNAITHFIEFERFLLDDNSAAIKYSQVKNALEQIYDLGKYYQNFADKIQVEIDQAESEMNAANNAKNSASNNESSYYSAISSCVDDINNRNSQMGTNELASYVGTLSSKRHSMPGKNSRIGDKSFANFDSFLNNEFGGVGDNIYLQQFNSVVYSDLSSQQEYSSICTWARQFLADNPSKTFTRYMKDKVGNSVTSNELFILLNLLYENSCSIESIFDYIDAYWDIKNDYLTLYNEAVEKTNAYQAKVDEKNGVFTNYKLCLSGYRAFTRSYQNDAYYYPQYVRIARNTVEEEAGKVKTQYAQIKQNIEDILTEIGTVEEFVSLAKGEIRKYKEKVNSWKSATDNYGSGDSFSDQNYADIDASLQEYNDDSVQLLLDFLSTHHEEYETFDNWLNEAGRYQYGNKKIDTIQNADDLIAAAASVKDSLPTIVDREAAASKLSVLYKNEAAPKIEIDFNGTEQFTLLEPNIYPIQFLRYLNEAYPEQEEQTEEQAGVEADYEEAKASLKSDCDGSDADTVADKESTGSFGYTYASHNAGSDLPSAGAAKKDVETNTYEIKENDDKVDVSSGMDSQVGNLDTILNGIGGLMENVLEKTYILSYIFSNFSYNTIVQDAIATGEGLRDKNASVGLTEAKGKMTEANITKYKEQAPSLYTLSNWKINEKNNNLFGGEIEYILYGNTSGKTNVTYAKASIYALRFVFNCIYAFTNSEIKTTTMSVGLAVQAATLGFVPYKVVQIILQLALAAGESALDLQMMMNGLKVAVVKTDQTWVLSVKGAINSAKAFVQEKATQLANAAISTVASGIQNVIDAGADKLSGAIADLQQNLTDATRGKIEEVTNAVFDYVVSKIQEKLNEIQFLPCEGDKETVRAQVHSKINELSGSLMGELNEKFGNNPIGDIVLEKVGNKLSTVLNGVISDLDSAIDEAPTKEMIGSKIAGKMTEIKMNMLKKVQGAITDVLTALSTKAQQLVQNVKSDLQGYVDQAAEELSAEAEQRIKDGVSEITNNYLSEYLESGTDAMGNGLTPPEGSTGNSVASMLRFGYKDYLMLFVFLGLVLNEDSILLRTADMIQMNIQYASTNGDFKHQRGAEFRMKDAYTYIYLHAEVDLNMLFLNLDFFTNAVRDDNTEVEGDLTPAAQIVYNGMLGY